MFAIGTYNIGGGDVMCLSTFYGISFSGYRKNGSWFDSDVMDIIC